MSRRHSRAAAATFALLAGTIGTTAAAHATTPSVTDLYVNGAATTCSDVGSGTQLAPFCTIQAAADVVEPGQTVHVAATLASYAPFTISRSGTAEAPITFVGGPSMNYPGITAPLVKGVTTTPSVAVTVSGAQYVSFSGIDATGIDRSALQVLGSSNISYDQAWIYSSGGRSATAPSTAVVDGASSDVTLSKDDFPTNPGWAIDAQSGASGLVITDDYLQASSQGGIRADGVTGVTVTADSINGNCGSAVDISGASSGSIENVVAVGSGESADSTGFCKAMGTSAEINVDAQAAPNVQSDYNDVHTNAYGSDYVWAGLAYTSPAAFAAATGQGSHDLGANVVPTDVQEGSPVIDSGDANAPDEPATDLQGNPRVDDPLVANTGTGDGYVDRGAFEFQNPLTISNVSATPNEGPAPLKTTLTTVVSNPWNTQGVTYGFNPGDDAGWPPDSAEPSATWTYATAGGAYTVAATAYLPDGTTRTTSTGNAVYVNSPGPLVAAVTYSTSDMQPDAASFSFPSTSPWAITNNVVNYGDKSPTVQFAGNETELNHTYAAPGTYTVTDTVTDAGGRTETATKQVTVGLAFVGITPQRVLDTRYGTGAPEKPVGPAGLVRVKVAGVDGIPSNVSAVTMNVTDTGATASSHVTAYADGSTRPNASALNFGPGQTNPNLVTVPVGQDGYVDLWNSAGDVELFADVQGYYTSQNSASAVQSGFTASGPTRVLDTRYGTGAAKKPVGPGGVITLTLPPASADADDVVLNVTETGATASGYVTAYPGTGARPAVSNLNFGPGQTTSNLLVVPLTPGGPRTVRLYNSAGSVNLIADVQGYYSNGADTPYVPISPTRVVDTRYGTGAPQKPIGPGADLRVKVAGVSDIPLGATSVLVNITGTGATASTYLTAFGAGTAPGTSNIDLVPGQTRPVLAAVPVDSQGYITIQNAHGDIEILADIEGYSG